MIEKIPVAHLHGGELTEGSFDDPMRHSITKMSHLHFTATEQYKKRVIQLGECPNRVFNVGAVGVDSIKKLILLSREEFEKSIDFSFAKRNLLVTFHSATLESASSEEQFDNLLQVLDDQVDTHLIFTKSNADTDSRIINKMIDSYVKNHSDKSIVHTSLGQLRYLSAMQYVDGVVGNSSSGLLEAPSFKIGTINIGDRQRGRMKANSVIDCNTSIKSIRHAFERLFSRSFQSQLQQVKNPYGDGGASDKILEIICSFPLDSILKKTFYDFD
jgi:GDP/UDP-N,N'-diacetylbacillosamine 2-epimerase (hydrolysing)